MTIQATIFDAAESNRLRDVGMAKAATYPFDEPVNRARNIAIMLAKRNGTVCADHVHEYLAERLPDVLEALTPKSWGSVMKSPKLKYTGRTTESQRLSRHSGIQRLWQYNPIGGMQ
jgi:hypothetical protein